MFTSIRVQCRRPDLGTDAAQVTVIEDRSGVQSVTFEFGNCHTDTFWVTEASGFESFDVTTTPEIAALRDMHGWNARELAAWVVAFEMEADAQPAAEAPESA